jgi:AraC-like DNA-binding protein
LIYQDLTIKIVRSVAYHNDAHWNYKVNIYPFNTLYFVLGGDGFVQTGELVTKLRAGYVYLIPANTYYSCWCETFIDKLYVEVYVELVPGRDIFFGLTGIYEMPFSIELIHDMVRLNTTGLRDRLLFRGELEKAIALFIGERQKPLDSDAMKFKQILDDIALNLSADIRLGDIARKYGWHPSALSRAFKQAFHCGLKSFVDQLLMNTLKQELITGTKSLKVLATEYRFCDAYYLSAFFKKHEGSSPLQYRNVNGRQ